MEHLRWVYSFVGQNYSQQMAVRVECCELPLAAQESQTQQRSS